MSALKTTLLKLALRAAERGDGEAAAEALRAVLGIGDGQPAPTGATQALSKKDFAELLNVTPEHVAHLIKREEIPPDAVLGKGRGQRIIVGAAFAALQRKPKAQAAEGENPIEAEGAAFARRRALRVVPGGGR